MVRSCLGDLVLGDAERLTGRELLQRGLPVEPGSELRGAVEQGREQAEDEAAGRIDPAGEVDGADEGFQRIGEDRGLVTPAASLLAAAGFLRVVPAAAEVWSSGPPIRLPERPG